MAACVLVAAGLPSAHGKGGKNSAEQTLLQMEQDWSQADIKKDADTLYRFLAEDWIGIDFEDDPQQDPSLTRNRLWFRLPTVYRTSRN